MSKVETREVTEVTAVTEVTDIPEGYELDVTRVYMIIFTDDDYYVGITNNSLDARMNGHMRQMKNKKDSPLYKKMAQVKDGSPLRYRMIEISQGTIDQCRKIEKVLIKFSDDKCLNVAHTEKAKDNIKKGIRKARKQGKQIGRIKGSQGISIYDDCKDKIFELHNMGLPLNKICKVIETGSPSSLRYFIQTRTEV